MKKGLFIDLLPIWELCSELICTSVYLLCQFSGYFQWVLVSFCPKVYTGKQWRVGDQIKLLLFVLLPTIS